MQLKNIVVCTRKSPLALKQAELAIDYLSPYFPQSIFQILPLVTTGDQKQNWSLEDKGGKGLFTKELEDALLQGRAHIAVHSAKDLPTDNPAGLEIAGFLPREDVRDVLVLRKQAIEHIATGSPRRRVQLQKRFPGAVFSEIRGNVQTRLKKISQAKADATVLAYAGLKRLGIEAFSGLQLEPLSIKDCVPAAGQGAIALQSLSGLAALFSTCLDRATFKAVTIERAFLKALGGGCHSSVAVHYDGEKIHIFHEKYQYKCFSFDISSFTDLDILLSDLLKRENFLID